MFDHVAIVGATGAVGQEFLRVIEKRKFPYGKLTLLASARSAGKTIEFKGETLTVQELTEDSFKDVDLALFSAGGSITKKFAPIAVESGAIVVDNSSAFRMDPDAPLVIPEVNPQDAKDHKGIIANPNCSTIVMLMACFPIHRLSPMEKIVVSTYQAASGAGAAAMEELRVQAGEVLQGRAQPDLTMEQFPFPIAFNAFSHNSPMDEASGYNQEETKMIKETHKILHDDSILVAPTCIRIGTFRAHAESVHLELKDDVDLEAVRKALADFPGVSLIDDRANNRFPMPLEASDTDDVYVGRLRHSHGQNGNTIDLFCCGDQILKGAALNAVQIAELL